MQAQGNHHSTHLNPTVVKKTSQILLSCLIATLLSINPSLKVYAESEKSPSKESKTIAISQIVEHPALNAVRESMLKTLAENGFESGKNLSVIYENAQGNIVTANQIATKLISTHIDVAVAISTPSAQTLFYEAKKQGKKIPIVFSAVSDPKAAQLESKGEYPITGITDTANLVGLLKFMKVALPELKTLGVMYNPSEANSVSTITRLKKLLKEKNIQLLEVTVNNTQDVALATKSLIGKVDALYFPQDNTVVSAIQTVVNVASQSSPTMPVILPIFSSDPQLIKDGVLAAVGYDYDDVGHETGLLVVKILKGEDAKQLPIHSPSTLKVVINGKLAKKLGLKIPSKLDYADLKVMD